MKKRITFTVPDRMYVVLQHNADLRRISLAEMVRIYCARCLRRAAVKKRWWEVWK
jgi:hypothetical protein